MTSWMVPVPKKNSDGKPKLHLHPTKESVMDKIRRTTESDCRAKDTREWQNSTGVTPGSTTAKSLFEAEGFVAGAGPVQPEPDAATSHHNARHKQEFERNK